MLVNGAGSTGNLIQAQSVSGHSGKGIALTNGANGGVVPPAITRMVFGSTFTVSGTSIPNATVQIYADPDDEGLEFLASTTATASGTWTNSTWSSPDTTALQAAIRAGARKLHAMQTNAFGTSEFSAAPVTQSLVAYVYATDTAARDAFSTLLSARGYTVTIGREVGDLSHYPLIALGDCYALWGFDNSPTTMTTAGANLFENFIANGGIGCGTTEISGLVRTSTGAGIPGAAVVAVDG